MDRERLGWVLGRGARMAAQTAWEAVDAATSPEPAATTQRPGSPGPAVEVLPPASGSRPSSRPSPGASPGPSRGPRAAMPVARVPERRQGRLAPLRRAGRSLFLEIAGSFFALFAVGFVAAVWRGHAAFSKAADAADRNRVWAFAAMAVLFGYFSLSSFVRARRSS